MSGGSGETRLTLKNPSASAFPIPMSTSSSVPQSRLGPQLKMWTQLSFAIGSGRLRPLTTVAHGCTPPVIVGALTGSATVVATDAVLFAEFGSTVCDDVCMAFEIDASQARTVNCTLRTALTGVKPSQVHSTLPVVFGIGA